MSALPPRPVLGQALLAALGLASAYLAVRLLLPVAAPLGAAALLAVAAHPLHKRLSARLGPGRAAAACAAGVTLLLVAPLGLILSAAAREAGPASQELLELARSLGGPDGRLAKLLPGVPGLGDVDPAKLLADHAAALAKPLGTVAHGAASAASFLIVFPLALFLALRDGPRVARRAIELLPVAPKLKDALEGDATGALVASVQAQLAVALAQGTLAVAGFALLGVRYPVVLGLVCGLLSPIPFVGSVPVWGAVAARLAAEGRWKEAAGLSAWFVVVVGLSDNVVRPLILKARLALPLPVLVITLVAGLRAFGLAGAVLGPLLASLAASALAGARARA